MIQIIYRIILLGILALLLWNLYDTKKETDKISATIVIIPIVLRMLMVK